jgi:polyisoprenoid-binding protein YceI
MAKIKWVADPTHSEITFKVKHMMITNVTGIMRDFDISMESDDEKFTNAQIEFRGKADSITTGNEQRDTHLRGADFFDVENSPEIRFRSTKYEKVSDEKYKLHGDLTIKGVTKNIDLDVMYGGMNKDPWGNNKAGFTVTGKINRKDFGLTWNVALETGGLLVSDEVRFNCEIQLVEKKD